MFNKEMRFLLNWDDSSNGWVFIRGLDDSEDEHRVVDDSFSRGKRSMVVKVLAPEIPPFTLGELSESVLYNHPSG